ncbi:MAG TPA: protein phosphatase 2C domain-containing protein [Bryobacterales bacterium]|nr:protein phosphatase 2C domain-containing protein [Bryobacterales bacterium]
MAFFGLSDTGCARPQNEDRILIDDRLSLFAVADGMGGHSFGEVAAELALAMVRQYVESSHDRADVTWPFGYDFNLTRNENRLLTAMQLANHRVWKRSEETPEYAGMGTTVAAVLVDRNKAAIASVGDSRVYLFRAREMKLLTSDDTWVSAMVRQGTLDPREVAQHPMRNVLTQAAGARETIDVEVLERALHHGDVLLLSSDGLHGVVGEAALASILNNVASGQANLEQSAALLVQAARDLGAPDNVSCILLHYTGEDAVTTDPGAP